MSFEIARSFPGDVLQKVFSATTERFHSPHSLLAVTTYHYAIGLLGSSEIARRLKSGRTASWPCAERPDGNSIRRFRNRNRLCVQQALERCLLGFCETVCPGGEAASPHLLRMIKAEARMRIHQAELADLESES